ncbi:MAG: hypothetical protein ACFHX7_08095 [Pseudomonadota bacterium]
MIRTIAVLGSSLLSVAVVGAIFLMLGITDETLRTTFVALLAAGTSLEISRRLTDRYAGDSAPGQKATTPD